jgi:hypothetical protein
MAVFEGPDAAFYNIEVTARSNVRFEIGESKFEVFPMNLFTCIVHAAAVFHARPMHVVVVVAVDMLLPNHAASDFV